MDIFPTIFHYMGIWHLLKDNMLGRPIFDSQKMVHPTARVNPDNEISLYADPYKLTVQWNNKLYMKKKRPEKI